MEALALQLAEVRVPQAGDRIFKDECAYTFDTPESPTGLYVCMHTFVGVGRGALHRHYARTKARVYLHHRRVPVEKPAEAEPKDPAKYTVLGIGVEGGFQDDSEPTYIDEYSIHLLDPSVTAPPNEIFGQSFPADSPDLPEKIRLSFEEIVRRSSAGKEEALNQWVAEDVRPVSAFAENLYQVPDPPVIPPRGWQCEESGITENLWLNLSSGKIFSGRAQVGVVAGTGAALRHYEETNFPLAVKLGTITASGADVWSYAEDMMVIDPHLERHLAHFGINMKALQKTDKTLMEMEFDSNYNRDLSSYNASCKDARDLFGPGYTGLCNLGNSCYLNSVMQTFFLLPECKARYVDAREAIFARNTNPVDDFDTQMAKLGDGLLSGHYSQPAEPDHPRPPRIRPRLFKSLVGRGHPEFTTNKQQDALEYFQHVLEKIHRADHASGARSVAAAFQFRVEERVQCGESGRVRYAQRDENVLSLHIPLERATNRQELDDFAEAQRKAELEAADQPEAAGSEKPSKKAKKDDGPRPIVPLEACLESFLAEEVVDHWRSPVTNNLTFARKTTRLATFPRYLMVQLRKFVYDPTAVGGSRKVDAAVPPADVVDLSALRGKGLQPGEEEMPAGGGRPAWRADPQLLDSLQQMGFTADQVNRALFHTGNADAQAATEWLFAHVDDADFNAPFAPPGQDPAGDAGGPAASADDIAMLTGMGFTAPQAQKALKACAGNLERAADWLFSHAGELDDAPEEAAAPAVVVSDGAPQYTLIGVISHMGKNTSSGHYVCHLKKDGQWVCYNDERVHISADVPWDIGYLYLFQRIE